MIFSCNVGDTVDAESQKMLLQDVLIHHPRREEKFGCGVISVKVNLLSLFRSKFRYLCFILQVMSMTIVALTLVGG